MSLSQEYLVHAVGVASDIQFGNADVMFFGENLVRTHMAAVCVVGQVRLPVS